MGTGKTVGIILMVVGVVVLVGAGAWITTGMSGDLTPSGAVLGVLVCGVLPFLILDGVGVFLFMQGKKEEAELADVRKKEKLLGLIQAQGKVSIGTAVLETKMTRDQVKSAIYELVNQGLFAGYIDWSTQTFYSQDASKVGSNSCPNCGGVRELVGKGMVKCPYCGAELFIPQDAPQTTATPVPPPANS